MKNSDRIQKVAASLTTCDALMIDDPIDLYYLTGIDLTLGRLMIDKTGNAALLVDGRYEEICRRLSPVSVLLWERQGPMPVTLPAKVGFDSLKTPYSTYESLKKEQGVTWIPLSAPIAGLRVIKEHEELVRLKAAADLCVQGYHHGCSLLVEGISEKEVAWEIEKLWRSRGGEKVAFDPIVAFGENSSRPHHRASERRLTKGDTVLLDLGVQLNHYQSDMTRIVFFGEPPSVMREIEKIVKEALLMALGCCQPGMSVGEIDHVARHFIEKAGYPFVHGLGHGVGLEVHEPPRLREGVKGSEQKLEPGMVITVEPGIYLPGIGGIRLEEEIVITADGYDHLIVAPFHPSTV